jgi:hypothetical protein
MIPFERDVYFQLMRSSIEEERAAKQNQAAQQSLSQIG